VGHLRRGCRSEDMAGQATPILTFCAGPRSRGLEYYCRHHDRDIASLKQTPRASPSYSVPFVGTAILVANIGARQFRAPNSDWSFPPRRHPTGTIARYHTLTRSDRQGALTNPGLARKLASPTWPEKGIFPKPRAGEGWEKQTQRHRKTVKALKETRSSEG
jgi:hypothetical protein